MKYAKTKIISTLFAWSIVQSLILVPSMLWADTHVVSQALLYPSNTLSAPINISNTSFQEACTQYKRYTFKKIEKHVLASETINILNAAADIILTQGIVPFHENSFYSQLREKIGIDFAPRKNEDSRYSLFLFYYKDMEKAGIEAGNAGYVPYIRFLNSLEKAMEHGYVKINDSQQLKILDCIKRVRFGRYPLTQNEKEYLVIYANYKGSYPKISKKLQVHYSTVKTKFKRISRKLGFDDINGVKRSEILKKALELGKLNELNIKEKKIVEEYAAELKKQEQDAFGKDLRLILEAALKVILKKGLKITYNDIIEDLNNCHPEFKKNHFILKKNDLKSVKKIRKYIILAGEKLEILKGKKILYKMLLACLEKAVKYGIISFSVQEVSRFNKLLADIRGKNYPFTLREKQVFIALALLKGGSYKKVSKHLYDTGLTDKKLGISRIGKLYASGCKKLVFEEGTKVTMAQAIETALNAGKLGVSEKEIEDDIRKGIEAIKNPLTPRMKKELEAALRIGLRKGTGKIEYKDISDEMYRLTGRRTTISSICSRVQAAAKKLGLDIKKRYKYNIVGECVVTAAENNYINCAEKEYVQFCKKCKRKKLNPLQKNILMLQSLGFEAEQIQFLINTKTDYFIEDKYSIVRYHNFKMRIAFKVKSNREKPLEAISKVLKAAFKENEVTDADLLNAAQWAGISERLGYIREDDLKDARKIRVVMDKICKESQCSITELFTLPKFKYIKRFVYHDSKGHMRVLNTLDLLQLYRDTVFQNSLALRHRLYQTNNNNIAGKKDKPIENNYINAFIEFFYNRQRLEEEIKRDLMTWFFEKGQVLTEDILKMNSAVVRKWGIRIYEEVFGMRFGELIKQIKQNHCRDACNYTLNIALRNRSGIPDSSFGLSKIEQAI